MSLVPAGTIYQEARSARLRAYGKSINKEINKFNVDDVDVSIMIGGRTSFYSPPNGGMMMINNAHSVR